MTIIWTEFAKKAAIGTVAGVGVSRGLRWALDLWRKKKGIPSISEAPPPPVLEGSGLILSALTPSAPASPYLFGLCTGRIAEMYSPVVATLSGLDDWDWGKISFRRRSAGEAAREPFSVKLENKIPVATPVVTLPSEKLEDKLASELHIGVNSLGMDVTVVNGTINGMESDALPVEPWKTWDYQKHHIEENIPIHERVFQFPESGRRILLREFVSIIRSVVIEDTYNTKTKQNVPGGYKQPIVIYTARKIIAEANCNPRDPIAVGEAIALWCQKHIRYAYDPNQTLSEDWLFSPYHVLETIDASGKTLGVDCDDQSIMTCSMLLSLGFTPVFILWGQDPKKPYEYNHISTALYVPEYAEKTGIKYYNLETTPRKNGTYQKPGDWTSNSAHCVVQVLSTGDF